VIKKVKTNYELIIELRNKIAFQIVGQKASMQYWAIVSKKLKNNSQEKIDALSKVDINKKLIDSDELYLQVIDKLLKESK